MLYGFLKVVETKTQLTKFVLLHWQVCERIFVYLISIEIFHKPQKKKNIIEYFQGEASPNSRRAVSASHLLKVSQLLKGSCIQVSATTEDDIDEEKIMEKLAKITSDYNFVKGVVSDKTPSPMREKPVQEFPKPVVPKVVSPIKFTPVKPDPVTPSPVPVEKRSPSKLVSPFLNNAPSPVQASAEVVSPTKQQNGSKNGAENGDSQVNKIRAMFSSAPAPIEQVSSVK